MSTPRIVVPLDESSFAEYAVPMALTVAERMEGSLELLSVYDDQPVVAGWPLSPDRVRDALRDYQQDVIRRIGEASSVTVEGRVRGGSPVAHTVAEAIADSAGTLVVMSTHGRGALSRSWFGSVADRVVRESPVPVILVRPEDGEPRFDQRPTLNRILIALDGSSRSTRGIPWATTLGGREDAAYTLVQAVPDPQITSVYLPDAVAIRDRILRKGEEDARAWLEPLRAGMADEGYSVNVEVVVGGTAPTDLLRFAEKQQSDLIVVATHGHSRLARFMLGSVADKLVRGAHCPVLVVRTGDVPGGTDDA